MKITLLGTSSMVPTKERNPSAVYLEYNGEGILFDCGEGTQRQMNIAGIKRTKVRKILLTHWHGDHVAGLVGLLSTISSKDVQPRVDIYGPTGTEHRMKLLLSAIQFDQQIDLRIHDIVATRVETVVCESGYSIKAINVSHRVPCLAYAFVEDDSRNISLAYLKEQGISPGPHLKRLQEGLSIQYEGKRIDPIEATTLRKGKKVSYVVDTIRCQACVDIAKESNVLICEATHANALADKAKKFMHMTAGDAAIIAKEAKVKSLILTHFSQRYNDVSQLLVDAQEVFENTVAGKDFMEIHV